MTMTSLDREMLERERVPHRPVRIVPKSYWVPKYGVMRTLPGRSRPLALNASAIGTAPGFPPIQLIVPRELRLLPNGVGFITVVDGWPGTVQVIGDIFINAPPIVLLSDGVGASVRLPVTDNPQTFKVLAGPVAGTTTIVAALVIPDVHSVDFIDVTVEGNILSGRIESAPDNALGFDTDQPISLAVARQFVNNNFRFCVRYLLEQNRKTQI
jgi:hypothetical protein